MIGQELATRIRPASEQILGLNQTYVDGVVAAYGMEALDGCVVEGDASGICSDGGIDVTYTTAYYSSMLLIMGESIGPKLVSEKWFSSVILLSGSVIIALVYGNVAMYISNYTANQTAYQRKMELLFDSMNHLQLPQNLKKRILMYYDHIWKEYRTLDGTITYFIPELSKQLSSEVYLYLRTNLILSVPFLRQCSPEVVQELVMRLKSEIFLPADYVVHKGAPGSEMYLISRGVCEVTVFDESSGGGNSEAAKRRKRKLKRKSSIESIMGLKENFTDFITQRNLRMARQRENAAAPLEVEPGTNLPKVRKSYVAQMAPKNIKKMRVKSFKLSDMRDVAGMVGERIDRAAGLRKQRSGTRSGKVDDTASPRESGRDSDSSADSRKLSVGSRNKKEKVVKELLAGEYFGEICLILNTPRTCNVRAKTFCELTVLERSDFDDVVFRFEEERKVLEEIIMEKYKDEAGNWHREVKNREKLKISDLAEIAVDSDRKNLEMMSELERRLKSIESRLPPPLDDGKLTAGHASGAGQAASDMGTIMEDDSARSEEEGGGAAAAARKNSSSAQSSPESRSASSSVQGWSPNPISRQAAGGSEGRTSERTENENSGGRRLSDASCFAKEGEDLSSSREVGSLSPASATRGTAQQTGIDLGGGVDSTLTLASVNVGNESRRLNEIIREIRQTSNISPSAASKLVEVNKSLDYLHETASSVGSQGDGGLVNSPSSVSRRRDDEGDANASGSSSRTAAADITLSQSLRRDAIIKSLEGLKATVTRLLDDASVIKNFRAKLGELGEVEF